MSDNSALSRRTYIWLSICERARRCRCIFKMHNFVPIFHNRLTYAKHIMPRTWSGMRPMPFRQKAQAHGDMKFDVPQREESPKVRASKVCLNNPLIDLNINFRRSMWHKAENMIWRGELMVKGDVLFVWRVDICVLVCCMFVNVLHTMGTCQIYVRMRTFYSNINIWCIFDCMTHTIGWIAESAMRQNCLASTQS